MRLDASLHRIGNDIVAAYLVDTAEGITIIDAGLSGQWNDLVAELAIMNRDLDDIKGVILTHGDSDHVGFAERLRRDRGLRRVPALQTPPPNPRLRSGISWRGSHDDTHR